MVRQEIFILPSLFEVQKYVLRQNVLIESFSVFNRLLSLAKINISVGFDV